MRSCGILMPIFSLPSRGGIGTLGREAFRFVDFLKKAGQSWWQILPLNPTNYGDSPYQSFCSFAGNPYFIDPELLIEKGLLTEEELARFNFGDEYNRIDYSKLYENRNKMLKLSFQRFSAGEKYLEFCKENSFWLDNYALFMTIKNLNCDIPFIEWQADLKLRNKESIEKIASEHNSLIEFYKFVQFEFYEQWKSLKKYANENGIKFIGDIPIYVAYDSAEVWSEPEQFQLNDDLEPTSVAGCPPDAFCEDGQLWGNPLYNWDHMKKDGFSWWKRRLGFALKTYDCVRIDHFRGFESYYSVPFGSETAKTGHWVKGPDMTLFREFEKHFGKNLPIIAEDLGFHTPAVTKLLAESGYPGMKVLQFAFDGDTDNSYLPHNYTKNYVVYTGTHDNDTVLGWLESISDSEAAFVRNYLQTKDFDGLNWTMMRAALMSVADTCILTMQDLIGLGSEARINTPSTLGDNWQWRIEPACINDWLANILYENTYLYGRVNNSEI